MRQIRHLFFGYYLPRVPRQNMGRVANELFVRGVEYVVRRQTDEYYCLELGRAEYEACRDEGVFGQEEQPPLCGLPAFLQLCRRRPGLPVGAVLAVVLFCFLSCFVWEVRISGADLYDEEGILQSLSDLGLHEGAFIPQLDADAVTSAYLASGAPISFMNIQRKGTVIYVNCRPNESQKPKTPIQNGKGTNIVASKDAIIEEITVESGRAVVSRGAVVKKGDLLVSGIYEGPQRLFITQADGQIMGRITQTLVIDIPFRQTVQTFDRSEMTGLTVTLLGRPLTLFSRQSGAETVTSDTRLYLFDLVRLPVSVSVERQVSTREETVMLTQEEAMQMAYARLHALRTALMGEGELISSAVEGRFTESGYHLECRLTYVENIAESIDFSYE